MPKKMTCRASIRAHRFLGAWFQSPTAGGEYAINSYATLVRQTLAEVAGQFSAEELGFFIAVLQGCHLTPELAGQHLAADIADALTLEPDAWEGWALGDDLVGRVQALPIFSRAALEIWARAYNYQAKHYAQPYAADEYVAQLLAR